MRYYLWKIRSSIRRWWMVVILHKSPEAAAVLDFFDNPKQPWNK